MAKKGLNPYDGDKVEYKISDLKDYQEYLALGGDAVYYTLGLPSKQGNNNEHPQQFHQAEAEAEEVAEPANHGFH